MHESKFEPEEGWTVQTPLKPMNKYSKKELYELVKKIDNQDNLYICSTTGTKRLKEEIQMEDSMYRRLRYERPEFDKKNQQAVLQGIPG